MSHIRYTESQKKAVRHQKPDEVTTEDGKHSYMKKIARKPYPFFGHELTGITLPGILLTIKSQQTAQQEYRQRSEHGVQCAIDDRER